MTQNDNRITADTLIFEIAESKFIAQGNAHSEVSSEGNDTQLDAKAPTGKNNKTAKNESTNSLAFSNMPVSPAKTAAPANKDTKTGGKQPFAWPKASDDQSSFEKPVPVANNVTNTSSLSTTQASATKTAGEASKAAGTKGDKPAEKIITDSDHQEYSKESGKFDATGHVHVIHGEISVFADKLKLVYGTDGKPETALFTGHVNAFQGTNNTQAETVTYYLATKRLQAAGNVRSSMLQNNPEDEKATQTKKLLVANLAPMPAEL